LNQNVDGSNAGCLALMIVAGVLIYVGLRALGLDLFAP